MVEKDQYYTFKHAFVSMPHRMCSGRACARPLATHAGWGWAYGGDCGCEVWGLVCVAAVRVGAGGCGSMGVLVCGACCRLRGCAVPLVVARGASCLPRFVLVPHGESTIVHHRDYHSDDCGFDVNNDQLEARCILQHSRSAGTLQRGTLLRRSELMERMHEQEK